MNNKTRNIKVISAILVVLVIMMAGCKKKDLSTESSPSDNTAANDTPEVEIVETFDIAPGTAVDIFSDPEFTETVETVDFQQLINFVDSMRQNRINVSIDDFGTGYSSLNLIKILSATTIKVDKSFIDHIDEKKDSVVVKSIIDIASELGFEVIAEGAETVQQVDILRSMGCNKIQGYYFDKPLPKDEFEKRLTDSNCYSSQFQIVKTKNESL